MSAPRFPAVVVPTTILAFWICAAASAAALETPTDGTAAASPSPTPPPIQLAAGVEDILKLTRAKVSDDVIIAFIQSGDRHYDLSATEVLHLRGEGVSERVLVAMLNQPSPPGAPPQPTSPSTAMAASAPQYVEPPATTAVVETAPASTVYVVPSSPTYYAFYEPWPYYWYYPWPYWYWWYPYPYCTFGFYWGGCYDYYDCDDNGKHHNGHHPPQDGNPPPRDGDSSPPKRSLPPPGESLSPGGGSGSLVSRESPAAGVNRTDPISSTARRETASARTLPGARTTSHWNNTGNRPTPTRATDGQPAIAAARGVQGASPTGVRREPLNNRANPSRPTASAAAPQFAQRTANARPTTVWSGTTRQESSPRIAVNQAAPSAVRSSPVRVESGAVRSPSINQAASRYVSRPTASVPRSSASPVYGSRPSGNFSGYSRPSVAAPARSMPSTGAIRSAGSYSGGAPRTAPSTGFRGGGSMGGGGRHR